MFQCPVCGYDQLPGPPANFSICSCCGTEFGNDDVRATLWNFQPAARIAL